MAKKKPARLVGADRDRLLIALLMHDVTAALNQVMRTRGLKLTLDATHKDHQVRLFVSRPGVEPQGWMVANSRTKVCAMVVPPHPELASAVVDIIERLAKFEARLILLCHKPPGKKITGKLQVQFSGARLYVLTIADVVAGKIVHETTFTTPDGVVP